MADRELPERLSRDVIYESDYVCLYADKVKLSDGICHVFAARVDTEAMQYDNNEVKLKKWVSRARVLELLKDNETKDGVSILALLFAFAFYT